MNLLSLASILATALRPADSGLFTKLVILDPLSAAFDTISHAILLTRPSNYLGLIDTALAYFWS